MHLTPEVKLPAMSRLLGMAKIERLDLSYDDYLCESLQIECQLDYPIAALMRYADCDLSDDAYWLLATPVHLVLQRDSFSLYPPSMLNLPASEAAELVESLNRHFVDDGMRFEIGCDGAWYLRMTQSPEIQTHSVWQSVNRNIEAYLPLGAGATKWHALLNEMQMLLFNHPVNQQREQRGELPINSIWVSGGGYLPRSLQIAKQAYGKGLLLRALQSLTGSKPDFMSVESMLKAGDAVLELDDLLWAEQHCWPELLNALRTFRLQQLFITFTTEQGLMRAIISPLASWQLWRQPLSIHQDDGSYG